MSNVISNDALTTDQAAMIWSLRNDALVDLAMRMELVTIRLRQIRDADLEKKSAKATDPTEE